jgi:GT2 family glycosyltransferase
LNNEKPSAAGGLGSVDRVAVIIVNFNGKASLMKCLESVSRQTLAPCRVIVVDNASSDGSAAHAAQAYPDFEFVMLPENTGFAAANNLAARMVTDCDWLALLNPDAYAAPDWLEMLCCVARDQPAVGSFGSRMLMADDPTCIDGTGDVYHASGLAWRNDHGASVASSANLSVEIFSPCAAAALYRRASFMSATGFDEDFFCYMEDVDLGFRLRLLGLRCLYVPQAVVRHEGSATTGGKHGDFSVYHGHRNLVWVFIKNVPAPLLWMLLPLHLLLNLATILWFATRGQGALILRAKRDAIKGLPGMWSKRQKIQRDCQISAGDVWRLMDKRLGRRRKC